MATAPEPRRPGLADDGLADSVIRAAVEDVLRQSSYRDERPLPQYGDAPPVPQPGAPPMSQKAVDVSRTVMACSLATVPPGLIGVAAMLASGYADPWVVGMICAAPAALAIPVFALARLIRGAKEATPPEHHHLYTGPVEQRYTHTSTRGVWAKTTNQE